jgi:WD domain, G-beta repeat
VFSPDGRLVAAAQLRPRFKDDPRSEEVPAGVCLIEAATGEEIVRLEISPGFYGKDWAVAFTPDSRGLVVADLKSLRVWDTASGERLHQRAWPESFLNAEGEASFTARVTSLATLPGGRAVTGMEDGEVLVWDLAPASWTRGKPARDLGREELDRLWSDLAADARKGHRALHTLAAVPAQSVSYLSERLKPATAVDPKRVEKLLADLDDRRFSTREAAVRELTGLRERIEPVLQQALKGRPTPEVRRRLQALLAEPLLPSVQTRQTLRAVAALERIGTPQARRLLEKLSAGADASETRAAKAALDRLRGTP